MARAFSVSLALGLAAVALSACNAVPVVHYNKIEKAEDAKGTADSFYLAQSRITIDKASETEEKAKNTKTGEYTITSRPVAYSAYKVGIRPESSLRVTTKVNIVKLDNTDLVSSVGVETTDNTTSLINSIGGALTKVVGLIGVLAPAPGPRPCIGTDGYPVQLTIDAATLAAAAATKSSKLVFAADGSTNVNGCITIELGEIPKDSMPAAAFPFNTPTSNFYYSACRDVVLSFRNEKLVRKNLRIADPNYVQSVEMPFKGSVTMHSECGVSVKTEASSQNNAIGVVDALAAQGKAIKDAIDASKK